MEWVRLGVIELLSFMCVCVWWRLSECVSEEVSSHFEGVSAFASCFRLASEWLISFAMVWVCSFLEWVRKFDLWVRLVSDCKWMSSLCERLVPLCGFPLWVNDLFRFVCKSVSGWFRFVSSLYEWNISLSGCGWLSEWVNEWVSGCVSEWVNVGENKWVSKFVSEGLYFEWRSRLYSIKIRWDKSTHSVQHCVEFMVSKLLLWVATVDYFLFYLRCFSFAAFKHFRSFRKTNKMETPFKHASLGMWLYSSIY